MRRVFASVTKVNKAKGTVEAFASVKIVDRGGDLIIPTSFSARLANFVKNPVMLFAHDYGAWPIGKVSEIAVVDNGLSFTGLFAPTDEGKKARENFEFGSLNAFSVGFIPFEWRSPTDTEMTEFGPTLMRVFTDVELLEISAVPVPANPDALAIAASWGMKMTDLDDVKRFVERCKKETADHTLSDEEEKKIADAVNELLEKSDLDLIESKLAGMVG